MKRIKDAFDSGHMVLDLDASSMTSAIRETVRHMVADGILAEQTADQVASALLQREQAAPTAIGHATAIPHAYLETIEQQVVLFVRLARPLNTGAPDGIPTRFLFFLLGPPDSAAQHLDTLAGVARLMSDDEFRYEAREARSGNDLLSALDHFTKRTAPEPVAEAAEKRSESLIYTGRLFGGLRQDVVRRWPNYLSDFRDGLHVKCVSSILFLFFACLAPAVTFGGVMAVLTQGQIGVIEMLVAMAACGTLFAIASGQPLLLLGGTGPMLILTGILYQLCSELNTPFLSTYAWTGLWTALILVLLAATDASSLIRFFTRFATEIFSALISLIFIYEAIRSLIHVFQDLDVKKHHDTALLSLLLAGGTYLIAMNLWRFRRSDYLLPKMREFLADFGPAIALGAMTIVAVLLHEVSLDTLPSPDKFGTTVGRPWRVDLLAAPMWIRFAAIGPALLVALLVFLNQNITAKLVNNPDHQLEKGEAYHYDLAVVGVLVGFCSLCGLPWLVAAVVPSLNHVRSLATIEEVVSASGQMRERIIHVRENRLTGLGIHLLFGLSLLFLSWLKVIPMAALYGLFLFMGVVSMSGNQFFERLSLWLRDPTLYPVTHYIRRVPRRTIHLFTLLQLTCLGVLWFVKSSALGILFPVFIALLVPIRLLARRFFAPEHLAALDAEEVPEEEQAHWAG